MLTRCGYVTPREKFLKEHRRELTVRPEVNTEFGFPPPPFKVYRTSKKSVCVPRFWGDSTLGKSKVSTPDPAQGNSVFVGQLRDKTSQPQALDAAMKAFEEVGGGILSLPCGYGKTTVSLAISAKVGLRTMIMVHKEFLANQWEERIKQFCPGATIGRVQQNRKEVDCDFVIAMLQSLSQKDYTLEDFEGIGLLIVDEAHHICARVFSQSLFRLCPKYTLGLSATPERKDGLTKVLHWFMGPTFFALERENQGDVYVNRIEYSDESFKRSPPLNRIGKVSLAEMITTLTENEKRNAMLLKLVASISRDRNVLILTDRRNHCFYLLKSLKIRGIDVGLYIGGMKEQELKESEKCQVIVGTYSQAHEGLDIPKLDTLVLASPKSDIKQAVGRILRETPGKKNSPVIYDIRDHWAMLYSMFYKRNRVYKEGGFKLSSEDKKPVIPFKGKCLL